MRYTQKIILQVKYINGLMCIARGTLDKLMTNKEFLRSKDKNMGCL